MLFWALPQSEQCLIDVDLALAIKDLVQANGADISHGKLNMLCPECKRAVNLHSGDSAHFEHIRRNNACSLSHKVPLKNC